MTIIPLKRGDTLVLDANLAMDITGWQIRCQVRFGVFVRELTATVQDSAAGKYRLEYIGSTADWPVRELLSDIEYTLPNGQIVSTETFAIQIIEDITL